MQADLLRVADLLLLFDLRDECATYLNRHLSQDNCITLLQLADQFGLETLRDGCLECLIKSLPVCAVKNTFRFRSGSLSISFLTLRS